MLKARPMRAKILLGLWLCLAFSLPALAQTENQRADSSAPDTQSYFSTSPKAVTLLYPDQGEVHYPYLFTLIDALGYRGWIGCEYRPRAGTSAGLGWRQPSPQ